MKTFYLNLIFAVLFIASMGANAAECSVPRQNYVSRGDAFYNAPVCDQPLKSVWADFGLTESRWLGFGWRDFCNVNEPLHRTLSALWLLRKSTPNPPGSINDTSGDFLRRAYGYSARSIEKIVPNCTSKVSTLNPAIARPEQKITLTADNNWTPYRRNRLDLNDYFFHVSVIDRAATIVHEARHTDGKRHDACTPLYTREKQL